ncbi:MAG TPA: PBP1A family penicillin-binding protein [Persephonella sp.]|nr:PBP1A family penicillin-binding protein [Hydrogenothermaceae bacterium]HIQ25241.1 PBP1A family penicillin-binding protein [Persephonella sp.]
MILVGYIRIFLLSLLLFGIIVLFGYTLHTLNNLPDISLLENWQPAQTTKVYDCKGRLLTEFFVQKRQFVPIEKIPDFVKNAFIATEDKSFYTNIGIDFEGILRAFINNIKAGHIVEGGSTISQQLVKNLFLSSERSFSRKFKELILAIKLNRRYSKDKILEMYLNQIYLGHGAYGVEAASQVYFGKHVWELNICEAAVLAGLPKAPSKYDPFKNIEEATERRDIVLSRMVEEGYISNEEAINCKMEGIELTEYKNNERISDYATEAVRRWFVKYYGYENLYKGGYKIYTTFDKDIQQNATEIVKDKLENLQKVFGIRPLTNLEKENLLKAYKSQKRSIRLKPSNIYIALVSNIKKNKVKFLIRTLEGEFIYPKAKRYFKKGQPVYVRYVGGGKFEFVPYIETALVAIDHKTGEIKALVGGYDIKKSKFNRATQGKRQVGSAFKPIVYLKALQEGYTQVSILKDEPISFWDPENFEEWIPENYENKFYGDVSLRYALVHSLNVASVWLFNQIGEDPVIKLAYSLGIKTYLPKVKSLVLGSAEVSPLELATVYATFANLGKKCEPFFIKKIINSKGKVVYKNEPFCKQVVSQKEIAVLRDILEGVIQEGTGRKAKVLELPLAGKTGTTNNYTDAWFAGFSPDITTVVWVGYDYKKKIGWKATGSRVALPIWIDFIASYYGVVENVGQFENPKGVEYYPINMDTLTLATENCKGKDLLFIIGTQPEVSCEGKYIFPIPRLREILDKYTIPNLEHLYFEEWLYEKTNKNKKLENKVDIEDNNNTLPDDFIFDIQVNSEEN